jgi:diguanylate cyclase (GGDEF)-like protein
MKFDPDDVWLDKIKGYDHIPQYLKRRLYRIAMVGLVGTTYLLDSLLLYLFTLTGTISIEAPLCYGLAGLVHVTLFSLLQWTGFSERFKNRHMTLWQMAYGISVQLMSITLAPQISPFFLATMFVIFSFGTLRIRFRQALVVWFLSMLAISVTMFLNRDAPLTIVHPSSMESLLIMVSFSLILLRSIALGYYAQALRLRMYELSHSFKEAAHHDELTGIYNRRILKSILEEQLSLQTRKGIPCSLAMLDIDHFKNINDTYGHAIGDQILKSMVDNLRMVIRDSDKLVRYGGEEFVLILAATSLEEAEALCERIRQHVAQARWAALVDDHTITVSIGLTEMMAEDETIDLLHHADAALYTAKRSGRNRVVTTQGSEPVEGGVLETVR